MEAHRIRRSCIHCDGVWVVFDPIHDKYGDNSLCHEAVGDDVINCHFCNEETGPGYCEGHAETDKYRIAIIRQGH